MIIYAEKVRPGWLYDKKTRRYEPGQTSGEVQVEDCPPVYQFSIQRRSFLQNLIKNSKDENVYPWLEEFKKWSNEHTFLLKGVKSEEIRGVNVEPDGENPVVRSVYHKYHVQMLDTPSEYMDESVESDLMKYLKNMFHEKPWCYLPPFVGRSVKACYIYPEGHKCVDNTSSKYALGEFICILRESKVSSTPSAAYVLNPDILGSGTTKGSNQDNSIPSAADVLDQEIPSSFTAETLDLEISTYSTESDSHLISSISRTTVSRSESNSSYTADVSKPVKEYTNKADGSKSKWPTFESDTNDVPNPEYTMSNSDTVPVHKKLNDAANTTLSPNVPNSFTAKDLLTVDNKTGDNLKSDIFPLSTAKDASTNKDGHKRSTEDDLKSDITSSSSTQNVSVKTGGHKSSMHGELISLNTSTSTTNDATAGKDDHKNSTLTFSAQLETNRHILCSEAAKGMKLKSVITTTHSVCDKNVETERRDTPHGSIMKETPTDITNGSYIHSSSPVILKEYKSFLENTTKTKKKDSTKIDREKFHIDRTSEAYGNNPSKLEVSQRAEEKEKNCYEETDVVRGSDARGSSSDKCSESKQSTVHTDKTSASKEKEQKKCKDHDNSKPSASSKILEPVSMESVCGMKRKHYGVKPSTKGKVILLLGASGSGKTTLVNLVANYFQGNKKADDDLVQVALTRNDAQSITKDITAYTFCSDASDIPITVIDTPGLNDSSGAEVRDHVKSLKMFLANISSENFEIHAIGFVAQAHLVRLTSSERLVMDHISTLFGEGVRDHIVMFITFSDNQENPPIVEAMDNYGVKCKLFLKLNNSALNTRVTEDIDDLDRVYWRKGCKSWKKCVKVLQELPALSVNTMKFLQSEVYETQVIAHVEKDLISELKVFIKYSNETKGQLNPKSLNVCESVWELATTLTYLKRTHSSSMQSVNDTVVEYTEKVCQESGLIGSHIVKLLAMLPSRPLVMTGIGIIKGAIPTCRFAQESKLKSRKRSRKIPSSLYCQHCDEVHEVERAKVRSRWFYSRDTHVVYKCKVCKCDGDVHEDMSDKLCTAAINPDDLTRAILKRTRDSLLKTVHEQSIPGYVISEQDYLRHLDSVTGQKYTEFIKEMYVI